MTQTKKFRASFSILGLWANGDRDRAIAAYFKLDKFDSPQLLEGRKWHEYARKYAEKNARLPEEFGGYLVPSNQAELKLTAQVEDWLEMVGILDYLVEDTIVELKTGANDPKKMNGVGQVEFYALLCLANGIEVNKGVMIHYNQYTKETYSDSFWFTKKSLREAKEKIKDAAWDMHSYLVENGLYDEYGAQR